MGRAASWYLSLERFYLQSQLERFRHEAAAVVANAVHRARDAIAATAGLGVVIFDGEARLLGAVRFGIYASDMRTSAR